MNIIQILPELKEGGVETGTVDIALGLQKKGHNVFVISQGGPLVKKLEDHHIVHRKWPVHRKNPFSIFWMAIRLTRFIHQNKIDIVHARSRVPAWIAWFACRYTHTPWVTTCHGHYSVHFGSRVMGWSNRVIVASEAIKNHMISGLNCPKEKIVLIPRGVDLQQFSFSPQPFRKIPTLAMIGRLSPIKGHLIFLEALKNLADQKINFRAQIVGDTTHTSYVESLKSRVKHLGLESLVEFIGHDAHIAERLKQIDILVMATTHPEAFGRVIIEAQATGIPVIASRIGGIKEVIDDQVTGFLFSVGENLALSQQIHYVLGHPQKIRQVVLNARAKVEKHYSKDLMINKTEKVYHECLRPKNILVIKYSSLGDMILISPSLRSLKQEFPTTKITLLTDPKLRALVEHCPYLDNIIYLSKNDQRWYSLIKTARRLQAKHFDVSIDFQNTYTTHALSYASGILKRYGYERKAGKWFLTHPQPLKELPPVKHQFEILHHMGIVPSSSHLEFWMTKEDENKIEALFSHLKIPTSAPLMGIHIGASWSTKRWHIEHLIQFCNTRTETIILTGDKEDQWLEEKMLTAVSRPIYSAVGKTTLRELGALIKRYKIFISPDSLPLHIAAALDIPTIGIFGPTFAHRHRPPSEKLITVQEKVECGPCYRSTCSHMTCMVKLTPDRIERAVQDLFHSL